MNFFAPVGTLLRVTQWCVDSEQASENVNHWSVTTSTGVGITDTDIAAALDAICNATIPPLIYNGATYKGTTAQILGLSASPLFGSSNFGAAAGIGGAIGMSRQTAGLIRLNTIYAGPGYRGRQYMPFPSTTQDVGLGVPTGAYVAFLSNHRNLYFVVQSVPHIGGGGSGIIKPVLYHRYKPGPPIVPAFSTDISSHASSSFWATQRRRGSFGRPNTAPI